MLVLYSYSKELWDLKEKESVLSQENEALKQENEMLCKEIEEEIRTNKLVLLLSYCPLLMTAI